MRIGYAARLSGLSEKTIRFYEKEQILHPPARQQSGYRDYDAKDVERIKFLRRVRTFGFSLNECRTLLALLENPDRHAREVKELASAHLKSLRKQKRELNVLCAELSEMINACSGGTSTQCAILDRFNTSKVTQDE